MEHADIVGERYRLDRKIGQGGTGAVWLAHDLRLERTIAIKFLFARDPQQQERLAKRVALEAKISASIQHSNVVQIFDYGKHESNIPYIVMEALSGFTLGAAFDATQSFSLDVVLQLMSDVLRGLVTVHQAGIVHRDLKPENIFLVREPGDKLIPKLLDFGISRSLEPDTRRSAVTTMDGMIIGTPQYMSSEQARGLRDIDERTDIYSLGVVLFEALTGIVPFDSRNTGDLLMKVIRDPAPPLFGLVPQIGEPLCRVVDKALSKDRAHRYADATAMRDALVAAAHQIPSALDRGARVFPPAAIASHRIESKRAGAGQGVSFGPSTETTLPDSFAPRVARDARHGGSDVLTKDQRARTTPAATEVSGTAAIRSGTAPRRWLTFAAAGVGLVVAAITATLAWTHREAAEADSGFIIVQAPTPPPTAAAPAQPSAPAQAAPVAQAIRKSVSEPRLKKPAKTDVPDPVQRTAADVAHAFARQKSKVIDCLDAHPEDMQSAPQLTVNVTVTAAGSANNVQLLPEAITHKPVSSCVTGAVLSMSFPPQAEPTTFRIPLLWRRK